MAQHTWIGQTIGGRYRIEELLGKGGMSAVYKANDPNLRRVVAIKLIHPHLSDNPEFVTRFKEEAAAVAQLRHPNIVQVFDFNDDNETFYMVMEFVPGETLQARLKRLNTSGRRFSTADALKYGINLSDAVDYAHKRSLIHRDIKPANLMLDVQGQAILMDFGIAKIVGGQTHTATGATIGTALYMSPEQIQGERVDERTDIYSIGVTLFEMVSGRPPFEADSAMTTMMMHLNDPVPDLRQIQPDTPPELVAVIEKALAKNRVQRFQSAAELSAALRRIQERYYATAADATMVAAATPESGAIPAPEPAAHAEDATLTPPAIVAAAGAGLAATMQKAPEPAGEMPTVQKAAPTPQALPPTQAVAASAAPLQAESPATSGAMPPLPTSAPAEVPSRSVEPPAAQSGAGEAAPPRKKGINPAWLAGGAATLLILIALIYFGGKLFSGSGEDPGATQTAEALIVAAVQETQTAQPAPPTDTPTVKASDTPPPPPTATSTQAPTDTIQPSETPLPEPFIRITSITATADAYGTPNTYVVNYVTENFTESRDKWHTHFFFNTVPPEQAGVPGYGPWKLTYGPSPFTGYKFADRPAKATQLCALVANADHSLYYPASGKLDTGNCFDLPR